MKTIIIEPHLDRQNRYECTIWGVPYASTITGTVQSCASEIVQRICVDKTDYNEKHQIYEVWLDPVGIGRHLQYELEHRGVAVNEIEWRHISVMLPKNNECAR